MATRASTHQKRLASTHKCVSTGTRHLQVWRVLTKQLGECRRVWQVLQNILPLLSVHLQRID